MKTYNFLYVDNEYQQYLIDINADSLEEAYKIFEDKVADFVYVVNIT